MVIIVQYSFPSTSIDEVLKVSEKAPPLPDYFATKGPYARGKQGVGITGIAIYEVADSRTKQAMDELFKFEWLYQGIPGYSSEITPYFEVAEALKLVM